MKQGRSKQREALGVDRAQTADGGKTSIIGTSNGRHASQAVAQTSINDIPTQELLAPSKTIGTLVNGANGRQSSLSAITAHHYNTYNQPKHLITIESSREFIADIAEELGQGYGFVPFIGAGMSAPSGAPLLHELHHYLHACIALALGVGQPGKRPWNPRTDQWPQFSIRSRFTQTNWFMQIRDDYDRRTQQAWNSELRIIQEAMGALAEWRGALVFLSRIVREVEGNEGAERYRLALDAPDPEVIDNCIRTVMGGRQPTLGHRMLATLATLLRLDIILTTNFDDLLETAFKEARNPLSVFEVHLASNLPPWTALESKRSLIKMHGNLYSLRVDYTLDALPNEADRWRFLDYLLSAEGRWRLADDLRKGKPPPNDLPFGNHLLVMGVSASERRTRAFIEHACRHLGRGFKVFWLCYSVDDVEAVEKFAAEAPTEYETFKILRHPHNGLLFAELYQTIRQGVPTSGIIFPSASRLASPPLPWVQRDKESEGVDIGRAKLAPTGEDARKASDDYTKSIKDRLDVIQTEGYQYHKLIVATSKPEASETRTGMIHGANGPVVRPAPLTGITSACAKLFEEIRVKQVAIWLDMNDVSSTDDLFEQLLDAASYRLGQSNPLPAYVRKLPEVQADEIIGLVNDTNTKWVFFLNARETPGTNLIDERGEDEGGKTPNNWLDDQIPKGGDGPASKDDDSNYCGRFLRFLTRLCGPNSPLISVVLMCRRKNDGAESGLVSQIRAEHLGNSLVQLGVDCSEFKEIDVIISTLHWANKHSDGVNKEQRRRFLQALISLQRIRYLATIWTGACGLRTQAVESDGTGRDLATKWIKELEGCGLVRRKPGGFIWIHSRTRTTLRRSLFNPQQFRDLYLNAQGDPNPDEFDSLINEWNPSAQAPEIHWELAHWYRRILAASKSPAAVFEAIYHACRSAEELLRLAHAPAGPTVQTAVDRLGWASSLLHTHAFLVQTQGYSRGSCRRLANIREGRCNKIDEVVESIAGANAKQRRKTVLMVQDATRLLRVRCTEVMRSIAREVGEDRLAYYRQNELRSLLSGSGLAVPTQGRGEATKGMLCWVSMRENEEELTDRERGELWLEWMRWWRWNGTLGIASRSFVAARRSLLRAALSITQHGAESWGGIGIKVNRLSPRGPKRYSSPPDSSDKIVTVLEKLAKACERKADILGHRVADQQRLRVEIARLVEQVVSLEMQEAALVGKLSADGKKSSARYQRIIKWISVCKTVVETIRINDQSPDSHDTIRALWCQSRLLMHEGMCQGRLNAQTEAMVLLADSESALHLHDPRRNQVDLAIIELHRAEVRLNHASELKIPAFYEGHTEFRFREMDSCFLAEPFGSAAWRAKGESLRCSMMDRSSERAVVIRTAQSLVQDGLSFLDRAGRILTVRRRNVGWMTWYFQRKISAIAMSVWATVLEKGTPIPFLGLEAAPRDCSTAADQLLADAQRMIRIDAYRLATIVEAYVQCVKAFFMRIFLERPSDTLPERQADMLLRLSAATSRLQEILIERQKNNNSNDSTESPDGDKTQWDNDLDPRAVTYINAIIGRAREVVGQLKMPLQ